MSWQEIIEDILESEGGLTVDHAGTTNFGISEKGSGLSSETIKAMNRDEAIAWYTKEYYLKLKKIPPHLLHITCDFAINAGIRTAIRALQKAANHFHQAGIAEDGLIGPNTLKAAEKVKAGQYRQFRSDHYEYLIANNPDKYQKFAKGWRRRIARV